MVDYFGNLPAYNTVLFIEQKLPKHEIVQWNTSHLNPSTLVQYLSYHLHCTHTKLYL